MGVQTTVSELCSVVGSSEKTKTQKSLNFRAVKRRSARLEGKSYDVTPYTTRGNGTAGGCESSRERLCDEEEENTEQRVDLDNNEVCTDTDDVREEKDYETHRKLRISENQARLASLGLQKAISELRSIILSGKPERRKSAKVDYSSATLRSSNRLKGISCDILLSLQGEIYDFEKTYSKNKKRLKDSAFLCARNDFVSRLSPEAMAKCCTSIRRGSLYDDINGVCCHSCREQVCGDEDIKQCADLDNAKHTELVCREEDIKQCADLDNAKHREHVCGDEDIKQCADLDNAKHTELVCREEDIKQCADLDNAKHTELVCREEDIKQCADLDNAKHREHVCSEEDIKQCADLDNNVISTDKDDVKEENDYETQRKLRISDNQARLASLGLQKTISELRSIVSSGKQERTPVRKCVKVDYSSATVRRSDRLKGFSCDKLLSLQGESDDFEESDVKNRKRLKGSASLCARNGLVPSLSPEALARRCTSKGRGSLYDGTYGICCHFCRQKKLCGEEDCKHCGNLDVKEPCIGKTECSVCRSSNGVFCRACLKVRYGEEMDDVRKNKQWMCPHCIEEKGVRPNWICNSSICLNKRKIVPTGIAIFKARKMGYESVAHLLMDELNKTEQRRAGSHKTT